MARITAIEPQRRGRNSRLYLDGEPALLLRQDVIEQAGLCAGSEVDDAELGALLAASRRLEAIESALRLIALRPRSEKDLRERLLRRGLESDAVDAALARMRDLGYLDDAAFARYWVETRQSSLPRSRRALVFELSRKGIGAQTARQAVEPLSDEEAAYAAARRRLPSLQGLDRQAFTRRLGSFLSGRGFSYGTARTVIERCWSELSEHAD